MKIFLKIFTIITIVSAYSCTDENPVSEIKQDSSFTGTNIFIGDSHVYGWDVKGYFPGKKTLNLGISGEQIYEIQQRVIPLKDTLSNCFVIAGTNDFTGLLVQDKAPPPSQLVYFMAKRYREFLDTASRRFKNIYMVSLFPIAKSAVCEPCKSHQAKTSLVNDSLKAITVEFHNVQFINVSQYITGEDYFLKENYTTDGVHLSKEAYDILSTQVRPYVQ